MNDRGLLASRASRGGAPAWPLGLLIALFILVHGAFLAGDLAHPDRFQMGDRSNVRYAKAMDLIHTPPGDFARAFVAAGPPGDYAIHAGLMAVGGPLAVILVQLLCQLALVVGAYLLVRRLDGRTGVAFGAGLLTLILPGGLMSPHMIATETFTATFLGFGTGLLCWAAQDSEARRRRAWIVVAFVLLGLAAFVRPQAIAAPIVLWLVLPHLGYERWPVRLGLLAALVVFPLSWMAFNLVMTGHFTLGRNEADLATNFWVRGDRIAALSHIASPAGGRMTLGGFLALCAQHPVETLRTYLTDVFNLLLNPGANHLFGRYLHLFDFEGDVFHWHTTLDQKGPLAVIVDIVRRGGLFLVLFAVAGLLHLLMLAGVAISTAVSIAGRSRAPLWVRLMTIVAATILVSTFAAGLLRWSHRASVEPLLACLTAFGLAWLAGKVRRRPAAWGQTIH